MQANRTLLSGIFSSPAEDPLPARVLRLAAIGAAATALGMYVAYALDLAQGGLISLFLVAAGLAGRFDALLEENRLNIWEIGMPPRRANGITAASVLAMFAGILAGYVAVAPPTSATRPRPANA